MVRKVNDTWMRIDGEEEVLVATSRLLTRLGGGGVRKQPHTVKGATWRQPSSI